MATTIYRPKHHVRFLTASSLFDGHDVSINIMRRIMQGNGAEVVHLGHNRSVEEVVQAAIQEDVQGIAISSYQGGHVEYFKYMYDLLQEKGVPHIQIFGGGGGVIIQKEIDELHRYGISRLYSPEDGREMGLQGMINEMVERCDFPTKQDLSLDMLPDLQNGAPHTVARFISWAEADVSSTAERSSSTDALWEAVGKQHHHVPVLGITGTGGAGKSSLTDELVRRFLREFPDKSLAILSMDPTKRKTGGALLGDRIRMNAIHSNRVYMRSLATRDSKTEISKALKDALTIVQAAHYDVIIVETSGIGQGDAEITEISDLSMYVMTSEYGAPSQLEKIDMIDFADVIVVNKYERKGSEDALRDVKKQFQRSHLRFGEDPSDMPVYGTIASQFNDPGTNTLFNVLIQQINDTFAYDWQSSLIGSDKVFKQNVIIPPEREQYLQDIAQTVRSHHQFTEDQEALARKAFQLEGSIQALQASESADEQALVVLQELKASYEERLHADVKNILSGWEDLQALYQQEVYTVQMGQQTMEMPLKVRSLSGIDIRKVVLPSFKDWGEIVRWSLKENVPGAYPFTAGVFPLKRKSEDPKRQFAGEGPPERTNQRFHYLSEGEDAKRLSTAFDSVTLYGEDPDQRPDIYGKVGESGVNICTLDDMKKLYEGFDLIAPSTSVSMTINGPAPIILAMFLNTAIDQQLAKFAEEHERPANEQEQEEIRAMTLQTVRGTVQADILKEDQGQNTCIFSTEFALRMMGDIQQYFIDQQVRHYYSVSISGYHIAEAGANPITQLALTLSNGFTYVEYYLSRGMSVDDFASNLSFFFSNGLDPEYTVIGRVARRIWAVVMKDRYGAGKKSQKLKYHVQTSGRSLHAQEMSFNDIRTTLQALLAVYDNCNSLHTNAYDEAVTTPTEESVRRASAIQLIITKELGLAKNENPLQGSFIVEELTDLVEEAVLSEFDRINARGGVLGAMEAQYQRGKIQEESMYYEMKKHNGELPLIGVNTFTNPDETEEEEKEVALTRATQAEKDHQIEQLQQFQADHQDKTADMLDRLQQTALNDGNIFAELMHTVQYASLGQMTHALYRVGGQYRRNM